MKQTTSITDVLSLCLNGFHNKLFVVPYLYSLLEERLFLIACFPSLLIYFFCWVHEISHDQNQFDQNEIRRGDQALQTFRIQCPSVFYVHPYKLDPFPFVLHVMFCCTIKTLALLSSVFLRTHFLFLFPSLTLSFLFFFAFFFQVPIYLNSFPLFLLSPSLISKPRVFVCSWGPAVCLWLCVWTCAHACVFVWTFFGTLLPQWA